MFRWTRLLGISIAVLGFGLANASDVHAVQAGGSLSVIPSNWGFLVTNQTIDVVIRANNTSSDTLAASFPADTTAAKAATLTGPVTVTLGCADDTCSVITPGVLDFVPVGGTGCVAKNAGVTDCTAGGPGEVVINFASVTLPAAGSLDLATIRVRVVDATLVPSIGIRAMTEAGAVRACSTALPSLCVACHADGCTKLAFTVNTNVKGCPHACPSKITFKGGLDTFEFHADIDTSAGFDPGANPFTISVSNALFNPIFTYTIPAGAMIPKTDSWKYLNNAAKTGGGISIVTVGHRDGTINTYRINFIVYDPNLELRATLANMTTTFMVGGENFSINAVWTQSNNGWHFDVP